MWRNWLNNYINLQSKLALLSREYEIKSQLMFKIGTINENKTESKNPMIPKRNKKRQAKYIKYLHLNLSQKVISKTPSNAKTVNPMITP